MLETPKTIKIFMILIETKVTERLRPRDNTNKKVASQSATEV